MDFFKGYEIVINSWDLVTMFFIGVTAGALICTFFSRRL